jgi:Tfp pilus assembly protein PilF
MTKMKGESPLLRRFASAVHAACSLRTVVLTVAALALAACSAGGQPRVGDAAAHKPVPAQKQAADAGQPLPQALTASYDTAVQALASGDFTEAELDLEQLVLEYPDFAGPYVNLAIIYMHDGRQDEADKALARALDIDPASAPANNQLGILRRQQGRFVDAERAYEAAIAADPDYALAYLNRGVLLDLYLKRGADALADYERYQTLRGDADETVAKWIIDLKRRVDAGDNAAQVAKDDAS